MKQIKDEKTFELKMRKFWSKYLANLGREIDRNILGNYKKNQRAKKRRE